MMKKWRIRLSVLALYLAVSAGVALAGAGKKVGIWIDSRSGNVTGLTATLEEAGFAVTNINGRKEFNNPDLLKDLDVLYFPGGWNALQFLDFDCRMLAIDFVAQGKGILTDFFRGAYVRGDNRPLFPKIGVGYNRVSSNYIFAGEDHEIIKDLDLPWGHRNWDHILFKTGPEATVFLKDGNGEAVGICGEPWGGRYASIGVYFPGAGDEKLSGMEQKLFLNTIRWLAGAKRQSGAALEKSRAQARLVFLRRERILDYTHHERGPDRLAGVIPATHNMIQTEVEPWKLRLVRIRKWLENESDLQDVDRMVAKIDGQLAVLARNYEALTKSKLDQISAADAQALLEDDPQAYAETLPEKLLPRDSIDKIVEEAEQVYARYSGQAHTAMQTALDKEHEGDLEMIPDLIAQCSSPDVNTRRRAAEELGRIGEPGGASLMQRLLRRQTPVTALIGLLDDSDGQVRRNAVHSLGWMQAKDAVPALVKHTKSDDKWMRRRAVQALGQIGDKRAVQTLLGLIDHPDNATAINAAMALGWIGDHAAAPALGKLLESSEGEIQVAAIQALGYIGDKNAVPALEALAEGPRGSGKFDNRLLAALAADQALADIEAGGRGEAGITQPDYLALRRNFYGVREEINYFIGRPGAAFRMFPQFQEFPESFFDYVHDGGATGFVSGWSDTNVKDEDLDQYLEWAGERGLRWILDLPGQFGGLAEKPGCAALMLRHHNRPAFAGFWSEESYPMPAPREGEFEAFLEDKYGPDYRAELGVDPDEPVEEMVRPVAWGEEHNRRVQTEYLDWGGDAFIDGWRETQEFMHGFRKASSLAFSISAPVHMSTAIGIYPRGGEVIDLHGPQSYSSAGTDMAFLMDLVRDGETRPVFCEFYNWYTPEPDIPWAERGYAMHLMHGESFFNFYFAQIFKQAPHGYPLWTWNPERWAAAERVFKKADDIRGYLGRTGSAANVALVYSDRTDHLLYYARAGGRPRRYYQHQAALWQLLQQAHVPIDSIWAETMTPEKLSRYKALVLVDAKSLTPDEESILRDWVKNGGVLLTSGTSTLFNRWGEQEKNYRLADVFGLDYVGHKAASNPDEIDSYCFLDGQQSVLKIVDEKLDSDKIRRFVHREVKPEKSLTTFKIVESGFELDGVTDEKAYEYDYALGYDHVRPGSAEVIAEWENGDPAITVNRFGKGLCIFRTEIYPGMSHTAWNWEMHALHKDFWPGLQNLTRSLIKSGLRERDSKLPLELDGCPERVEAVIRTQPHETRWLLHFLNFDPNLDSVDGFKVELRPPSTDGLNVYYADDGQEIEYEIDGDTISFVTRGLEIHDVIVVDWKEGGGSRDGEEDERIRS